MKNLVILKQVDKLSGDYQEFKYKSFESLEDKAKVFKSILAFLDNALNSECIIQFFNIMLLKILNLNNTLTI